ncbi:rsbT co-antagonist protein RsbR [Aureibacillus halotolerans]|uniref:RsbT co-antagonist protein RsbR n=2 Tax=Aureibacillus halotolerans TaxID=1508390 RepID=A0A4R6TSV9_9BACI|nr:rsbT co-antagonist protein RsbR [Aureibacillus halotolerans]
MPSDHREENAIELFDRLLYVTAESISSDVPLINEEAILRWGEEAGQYLAMSRQDITAALTVMKYTRRAIWDLMDTEIKETRLLHEDVIVLGQHVDMAMDTAMTSFSKAYLHVKEEQLLEAQRSILELSTPVVPVLEGVAILPLVGEVDTQRFEYIMEQTLATATQMELDYMIIDVSGIHSIDTKVAHHLYQVIQSLDLIGISSYLTGLRPAVTQTIVSMGVTLASIKTCGTVKQAMDTIIKMKKTTASF